MLAQTAAVDSSICALSPAALGNIAGPVARIRGPATSPDSTRSRSCRVFSHDDQMSNTLVKPYWVSIIWNCRVRSAAGTVAGSAHILSRKWTWLFQKPAVIVDPVVSMTVVPRGTRTDARRPTDTILPPSIRTAPSRIGGSVGLV